MGANRAKGGQESDVALLTTDQRGDVLACNSHAAALFELDPDRIVGRSIARLIPGSELLISVFLEQREPVRLVGLRADGEFPLDLAVQRWGEGEQSRFVAVIREA